MQATSAEDNQSRMAKRQSGIKTFSAGKNTKENMISRCPWNDY
jgi:hypothetical protein